MVSLTLYWWICMWFQNRFHGLHIRFGRRYWSLLRLHGAGQVIIWCFICQDYRALTIRFMRQQILTVQMHSKNSDIWHCRCWNQLFFFTTINSTIGTLQLFDETMNITQGGPANATITISQYIYNLLFKYSPDFGYAAAVSYVVVVLIVVLSFIQKKVGEGKDA